MKPINVTLDKRSVFSITLLMAVTLMAFVLQKPVFLVSGTVVCAVYAFTCYRFSTFRNEHLLLFLAVCILFLPGLAKFTHGLSPYFYFFSTLATFFAAKAVSRHTPEVLLIAFRLVYAAAVTGIAYALYVYWGMPEPLGEVIDGSSANGIPAYLIVIQIGLSLCNYVVLRRLPMLSPMLTFAVAFFGYGRGSLVVAGLIIVVSLLFNLLLIGSSSRLHKFFYITLLLGLVGGLAWEYEQLVDLATMYTKFGVGMVDSNRLEIWDQYLSKINPWTLVAGADYAGTVIESEYSGNPHISFIRTHAFFGLPVTLLALVSPLFVFFGRKAWFSTLVFGSFIGLAVMRAASEPIFFPTLLDFFYFLYFFLFVRYAPERRAIRAARTEQLRAMVNA